MDKQVQAAGDEIASKLTVSAKALVPDGVEVSVWAEDGRVFVWSLRFPKGFDLKTLDPDAGLDASNPRPFLDAWGQCLNSKVVRLTIDAVRAAGSDPAFNPETDATLSVSGDVLPHKTGTPTDSPDRDTWYWASFTGSRRNASTETQGRPGTPADGEPRGGQISVVITPNRAVWGPKETISGTIIITNTGKQRVPLSAWWENSVNVKGEAGQVPEAFFMQGHVSYARDAARFTFLDAGERHERKFTIYTDRMHTMRHGYYLPDGKWLLTYSSIDSGNIKVMGDPAVVEVRTGPGDYTGPRIQTVRAAGKNLVLNREGGILEVVDVDTGARLSSRTLEGNRPDWIWYGADTVFGPGGRLVAYCTDRSSPIVIESMFDDAPPRKALAPPEGLEVGVGGFSPGRFSADGKRLFCRTNFAWVDINLATGKCLRTARVPEMWASISPDGQYLAEVDGSLGRIVGYRGQDTYSVTIRSFDPPSPGRVIKVDGHGAAPTLTMGAANAYLNDEFEPTVVVLPYADGPRGSLKAEAPADVLGETPDGALVALSWPRWEHSDAANKPTTVGVFRISDETRLCTVAGKTPLGAALLTEPARLVCFERKTVGGGFGGGSWLLERATIYNATTGERLKDVDLTPKPGALPVPSP